MAGYAGFSKSNNAINAENEGRFPLSIAKKMLSTQAKITQKVAEIALKATHSGEWHHTSKFYNRVNYYDIEIALKYIEAQKILATFPNNWKDELNYARSIKIDGESFDERHVRIDIIDQTKADELSISKDLLINILYEDWTAL